MTAVVQSRGIWWGGPQVKEPRTRVEVPSGRLNEIFFTLIGCEAALTKYAVFIDADETADATGTIQMNMMQRLGKEKVVGFTYPADKKTAGVHKIVIKTGVAGTAADKWMWTSPTYEVIIPESVAAE